MAQQFNDAALIRKALGEYERLNLENEGAPTHDRSWVEQVDGVPHVVLADADGPVVIVCVHPESAELAATSARPLQSGRSSLLCPGLVREMSAVYADTVRNWSYALRHSLRYVLRMRCNASYHANTVTIRGCASRLYARPTGAVPASSGSFPRRSPEW